ncbi:MAG: TrbC/VirB2 family protein [Candidatus Pacebacteria bacterium]|nr:TrbC/VirB2 family protein [Candidatus Paceibacterota bacterium]
MKAAVRLLLILALVAPAFASAQTAPAPVPTCKLFTSATTVNYNTKVRLDWTTTNVTSGYLNEVGAIPPNGFAFVVPGKNTTYTASFAGPGGTVVCRVGIVVRASAPAGGGSVNGGGTIDTTAKPIDTNVPIDTNRPVDLNRPVNLNAPNVTLPTVQTVAPAANPAGGGGLFGSIVPPECRSGPPGTDPLNTVKNCDICAMGQMAQNIINFLLGLTIPAAALLFAWAGILFFSSRGVPEQINRAKKIFKTVVIGFVIAISAWLLVNTVIQMLVTGTAYQDGSWKSLNCTATRILRQEQIQKTINEYLSSSLPGLQSYSGSFVSNTGECPAGSEPQGGRCIDNTGGRPIDVGPVTNGGPVAAGIGGCAAGDELTAENFCISASNGGVYTPGAATSGSGPNTSCPAGYVYSGDDGGYCQNPNKDSDWVESCPTGYVYSRNEGGYCENPNNPNDWKEVPGTSGANVPSSPSQTGVGNCSLAAAESFGSNAAVMSCIAGRESSCNPLIAGDQGYSIGLYQINMTANNVTCNGATINCPRAFNGSYSCRNGQCGAYKNGQYLGPVQTIDAGLAAECKSVLQNPACNVETAQQVLNTPRGLNNWSTYAQCR